MMLSLNQIENMEPWRNLARRCPVCREPGDQFVNIEDMGIVMCRACCEEQVIDRLTDVDMERLTPEEIRFALSETGPMVGRLTVLIHSDRLEKLEILPGLLIANMGFSPVHPLSRLVRRCAYEATVRFKDKKAMLAALLGVKNYISLEQKLHIVDALWAIAPDDERVKRFIKMMAGDSSPGVRSHLAYLLWSGGKRWMTGLFPQLERDANPLVREACRDIRVGVFSDDALDARSPIRPHGVLEGTFRGKKNRAKKKSKKMPVYSSLERLVSRHCNSRAFHASHGPYLRDFIELLDKKKFTKEKLARLKTNSRESRVRLLAAILENKALFQILLDKLPGKVVELIYLCAFEKDWNDMDLAWAKLRNSLAGRGDDRENEISLPDKTNKDPDYFLFEVATSWRSYRHGKQPLGIQLIPGLADIIKEMLPPHPLSVLHPVSDIQGKVEQEFSNIPSIFEQLPVILSFIEQDNLDFSKDGETILVSSLKKMSQVCGIREFYNTWNKDLKHMRVRLLASFLLCASSWTLKEVEDLPVFLGNRMRRFLEFKDFKSHRSRDFLKHISHQLDWCDEDEDEIRVRRIIGEILHRLPPGEWISMDNIARLIFYSGMDFIPFEHKFELSQLYMYTRILGTTELKRSKRMDYRDFYLLDAVTLPLVKGFFFLFGVLGLVDLGYSAPNNNIYRRGSKSWLSIYDGLKYIRLTEFGDYVAGGRKTFTPDLKRISCEIEVDGEKTMLSIYGDDPIKRMALEKVGCQVNKSSYMVTYQSFLEGCSNTMDVKNKIQFFRKNIAKKPPAIWEAFFKDVLARMNSLEPVDGVSVFRVKPDKVLLSLLSTDKMLKKYLIKAENHHLVVKNQYMSQFKTRLAQFGFFVG